MTTGTQERIGEHVIHPVASIFPELDEEDLDALAQDIAEHGQQHPVLTFDGMVIDGRNRLLACERAGVEPIIRPWSPRGSESVLEAIVALNVRRRHLTPSQRAMIAAMLIPHFEREAKERQEASRARPGEKVGAKGVRQLADTLAPEEKGASAEHAAKSADASTRSTERAARVAKKSKKLAKAVSAGKVSLGKAEEKVRAKERKADAEPVTAAIAQNQERWKPITKAVGALSKALTAGMVLMDDGSLPDEKQLVKLIKDGRPMVKSPEVFASTLDGVRRAVAALAPLVRESYQKTVRK